MAHEAEDPQDCYEPTEQDVDMAQWLKEGPKEAISDPTTEEGLFYKRIWMTRVGILSIFNYYSFFYY
jgi:hypothetical protein